MDRDQAFWERRTVPGLIRVGTWSVLKNRAMTEGERPQIDFVTSARVVATPIGQKQTIIGS